MAKRHERTRARTSAIQVLYSSELNNCLPSKIIEEDLVPSDVQKFSNYAQELVCGVEKHSREIDNLLNESSENWALDRMPVVDRCILRIAVYEMLYVDKVPMSVSINEAVELAKDFGGEDESGRFVNGILGKIAKTIEAGAGCLSCESGEKSDIVDADTTCESVKPIAVGVATDCAFDETSSVVDDSGCLNVVDIDATSDSQNFTVNNSKDA